MEFPPLHENGRLSGWRVKTTATHHIDVLIMLVNYRITTTPVDFPHVYDRHWCYATAKGASREQTRLAAIAAAWAWDGADDTEPVGWNKNGQTKAWREPAHRA